MLDLQAMGIDPRQVIDEALERAKVLIGEDKRQTIAGIPGAYDILKQVLACDPNEVRALILLGLCYLADALNREAVATFDRVLQLDPVNTDGLNNRALAKAALGDVSGAILDAEEAVRRERRPDLLSNLAMIYRQAGRYEDAIKSLETALEFGGRNQPPIWINMGGLYGEIHDLDKAEYAFTQALELDPEHPSAHLDLAYTHHLAGKLEEAWEEYEYRFDCMPQLRGRYDQARRWRDPGHDLDGKTVVVYSEQGIGDGIMFARYLPELKKRGCRVIYICQPGLLPLFEAQDLGVDQLIDSPAGYMKFSDLPEFDVHASLLSLPYLLDMPVFNPGAYIQLPGKKVRLPREKLRIGVCWAGSPMHANDEIRSCHARHFGCLDLPGVELVSLQYDTRPRQYRGRQQIVDFASGAPKMTYEPLGDFLQTAKAIASCDLVVTVDTAVLHLAGAMEVPTYALLAYNPDWRWGLTGEETPWYDSVTLLRQERRRDWSGVFAELGGHLARYLPAQ